MEKILIIGGNAAGLTAASRAKRLDPRLRITVLEKTPHISYSTCGIPYFLQRIVKADDLVSYTPSTFEKERDIRIQTDTLVERIESGRKRVIGQRTDTREQVEFSYDRLLIATGVRPKLPDIPGTDLQNVFTVLNLQDALRLNEKLDAVESVAIVGAGYVGLEMAESLFSIGKKVHIFEKEGQVLNSVDRDMAQIVEYELQRFGVKVSVGARVLALVGHEGRVNGVKAGGSIGVEPAQMVLLDTGVEPNVSLAHEAGVQLGKTGAIAVTSCMETNVPAIYADGNCAETYCPIRRRPVLSFIGTVAAKQGRIAGDNLAARRSHFLGAIGTTVLKVFDLSVARTGLSVREANAEGIPVVFSRIEAFDRAAYYPTAQKLWVKLVAERDSGRLLGAQVVGYGDSARRVEVAATAIMAGMRTDELSQMDLAYSPPFGNLWDPLLIAAQSLMKKLD